MSEQNDVDAQLAEVLARIYRDKANSERIARQADIDVTRITLSDTAIVTWSSIILQAKLQSRVNRLFDIVTQEYPDYLDLTGVIAEFKRVNRSPSTTLTQATAPDIPVGREQPSSDQIQGWLDLHGFTQNPFIQSEANREKSLLPEYFIKTPVLKRTSPSILNIQSTVIAAGRGCGKTAHRIMMARDCQPHNTASSMLAVEYTTFSQFGERVAQGLPSPGVRDHLTLLLNIIIEDWIRVLLKSSDLASRMPVHNLGRLKWFWLTYGTSFNQPSIYYAGMIGQLLDSHAYTIDWIKFANAWKTGRLSSLLKHTPIWMYPQVRLVGLLVDATVEPLQVERLPADALFQQLFDLVQASGLTSVCIVVDRTDESHMLATSPERVAEMLTPYCMNFH
ncbi:MAG: hypothetical protein HZY76_04965 [Anaerolineae bacterium]|nr:MAG: hypothetical protein HZY76_04965 [Anaerolineae bacterium]